MIHCPRASRKATFARPAVTLIFKLKKHRESVDTKYLQVLIQLGRLDLLKKEDIQWYHLLHELCNQYYYFAEKRFRFFVEWDPNALTQTDIDGLPLYDVEVVVGCFCLYYYSYYYLNWYSSNSKWTTLCARSVIEPYPHPHPRHDEKHQIAVVPLMFLLLLLLRLH